MAAPFLLRWALLILSAAVVVVAVALRLQQQQHQQPLSSPSDSQVRCYRAIRTHDQEKPDAKCFTVTNGVFKSVQTTDEGIPETAVHHPGYVIPGLWDGHGHLLMYGEFLHSVDLFGATTLDEVRNRIKAYVDANPGVGTKDRWLRGVGWDQTPFGRMPTADDLAQDPQLSNLHVMLDRIDVHCTWVSQPILDLLPNLPDEVAGGEIVREPGMGVFCDNAMDLVTGVWPKPSTAEKASQVRTAMARLNEVGLVGMHDAGMTPSTIRLYRELSSSQDWTVRVYGMLECDKRNAFCPEDVELAQSLNNDDWFTVQSVKLFADGALGSWGSAMIEPYDDHPWTSGSLLINASSLIDVTASWAARGFQVCIHAIGDLANRYAMDAIESALKQQCPGDQDLRDCQNDRRFRIEHAQIIHPDDQARLQRLGIIPSVQPTHATSDFKYALARLGQSRLSSSAYRMRSLLPTRPILGSDFPVEPPNPLEGIYAAVARRSPHTGLGPYPEDPKAGFLTEEALDLDEALRGFTVGPAYGGFMEGKAGVIKDGSLADWVVLDAPLEGMDVEDVRSVKVRETWVGGRRVYSRDD